MTENWRKNTATSLTLTLPLPNVGRENSLPFSRMEPGVMRSRAQLRRQSVFGGRDALSLNFLARGSLS